MRMHSIYLICTPILTQITCIRGHYIGPGGSRERKKKRSLCSLHFHKAVRSRNAVRLWVGNWYKEVNRGDQKNATRHHATHLTELRKTPAPSQNATTRSVSSQNKNAACKQRMGAKIKYGISDLARRWGLVARGKLGTRSAGTHGRGRGVRLGTYHCVKTLRAAGQTVACREGMSAGGAAAAPSFRIGQASMQRCCSYCWRGLAYSQWPRICACAEFAGLA